MYLQKNFRMYLRLSFSKPSSCLHRRKPYQYYLLEGSKRKGCKPYSRSYKLWFNKRCYIQRKYYCSWKHHSVWNSLRDSRWADLHKERQHHYPWGRYWSSPCWVIQWYQGKQLRRKRSKWYSCLPFRRYSCSWWWIRESCCWKLTASLNKSRV